MPIYKGLLKRFITTIKLLLMIKHVTRFPNYFISF